MSSRAISRGKPSFKTQGSAEADIDALLLTWIQGCLEETALYGIGLVTRRARELAAGYPVTQAGTRSGFTRNQTRFLRTDIDISLVRGRRPTEPDHSWRRSRYLPIR